MVKKKNKKRNKKIVIAVAIIVLVIAGSFGALFFTGTISAPSGTGQGLFGLFGLGGGDYGTGIALDTNTKYSTNMGVSGIDETMGPVFYRIIDASIGSEAKVTAQGMIIVNANRPPEQWWISPYIIDKITGYWYIVYYKESTGASWTKIIDKTSFVGSRVIRVGELSGNGFQSGWTLGLGSPPFLYECNPISFWIKASSQGTGAIKVEVHCSVSWKVGTETVGDILCSSDEAYIAPQPPNEVPPPATPGQTTLTITTTPGAVVKVYGVGVKTADADGRTVWTNMRNGAYEVLIQYTSGGYHDKWVYVTFPDTTQLSAPLTPTGGGAQAPSPYDLTIQTNIDNCIVKISKGSYSNTKSTTNYASVTWTDLDEGRYDVTISKSGLRTQTIQVDIPGAGTVQVYMQREYTAPPQEPVKKPVRPEYNQKPQVRTITGPSSGNVGVEYEFSATAYDPDDNLLLYKFYWGDGTSTGWLSDSKAKHTYISDGLYNLFVQAYDGLTYGDSNVHPVAIGTAAGSNQLIVPLITGENFVAGTYATAIIKVMTDVNENDFDIKVTVISASGDYLINNEILPKTKSGNMYTASATFKCDDVGIVTISAQTASKSPLYSDSLIRGKQIYCSASGEAPAVPLGENVTSGAPPGTTPKIPGFELPLCVLAIAIIILMRKKYK